MWCSLGQTDKTIKILTECSSVSFIWTRYLPNTLLNFINIPYCSQNNMGQIINNLIHCFYIFPCHAVLLSSICITFSIQFDSNCNASAWYVESVDSNVSCNMILPRWGILWSPSTKSHDLLSICHGRFSSVPKLTTLDILSYYKTLTSGTTVSLK